MDGLSAEQIVERIANANGVKPAQIREKVEQTLQDMIADPTRPRSALLAKLLSEGEPTTEELLVALEYELYDALMPKFPGWEWDGEGYRNTRLYGKKE